MSRRDQIIEDAEKDYGVELDANYEADPFNDLCDGTDCRHPECECWDYFEQDIREQLKYQRLSISLNQAEAK